MTDTAARSSLADEAYAEIRARIVDGRIPPGSRVTVRPIAERLRLSATPIKAALVALERDGVIVSVLHRGFFVPELSLTDMREIYEMREALDGMAVRLIASSPGHAASAAALGRSCREQAELLRRGDIDGYRRKDVEFHRQLWTMCGNTRIQRAGEPLMDQMLLGNAVSARHPGRGEASVAEHFALVEAIAAGDAEMADRLAHVHIRRSRGAFEGNTGT